MSYCLFSDGLLFERVSLQLDRILALNELASHHPASATINAVIALNEFCTLSRIRYRLLSKLSFLLLAH